jgi:predicted nucleic acid-binding protein
MSAGEPFFDTNVLLYLLSDDDAKADLAEALVAGGGVVVVHPPEEAANATDAGTRPGPPSL